MGVEITPSMQAIVNAAVKKAYGNEHEIEWMEVLAGERAFNETGSWLPDETMEAFKKYGVGIKGPLTTPVGGIHLSIQQLSLVRTLTQRKRKTASRLRMSRHQLSRSRSLPTRSWAVWYSSAFTQVRLLQVLTFTTHVHARRSASAVCSR